MVCITATRNNVGFNVDDKEASQPLHIPRRPALSAAQQRARAWNRKAMSSVSGWAFNVTLN